MLVFLFIITRPLEKCDRDELFSRNLNIHVAIGGQRAMEQDLDATLMEDRINNFNVRLRIFNS